MTEKTTSVVFHIAARDGWEAALKTGIYTPGSFEADGYVHCSTAEQHARVANALFAGRTDLVLLLIDTARLGSDLRFESFEPGGPEFPHLYGPLDVDAVFEVSAYGPEPDGRFRPHQEASGLAATGGATLEETVRRAQDAMAGYAPRWWIAGGWSIDLFLGGKTRPHADLEISVLSADQEALFEHLRGWDLRLASPEGSFERWAGQPISPPYHQVWARRGPGAADTPAEFAADPSMLDFLLEESEEEGWVYRRDPRIRGPFERFGTRTADGIPFVRPEITLLFKSREPRHKDERDLRLVLPALDAAAARWLAEAIEQAGPGHPWRQHVSIG